MNVTTKYADTNKKAEELGEDVTEHAVRCTRTVFDLGTRICFMTYMASCLECKSQGAYVHSNYWEMQSGTQKPLCKTWFKCVNNPANCYRQPAGNSYIAVRVDISQDRNTCIQLLSQPRCHGKNGVKSFNISRLYEGFPSLDKLMTTTFPWRSATLT